MLSLILAFLIELNTNHTTSTNCTPKTLHVHDKNSVYIVRHFVQLYGVSKTDVFHELVLELNPDYMIRSINSVYNARYINCINFVTKYPLFYWMWSMLDINIYVPL